MGSRRGLGGLLEASWRPLGAPKASWSAKGGLPGANTAILGPKALPKGGPKRGPKRGPKAIRAESGKIIKVDDSTQDLLGF